MEHQKCYIYEPPESEERSSKRQRTGKFDPQAQLPERLATYRELWAQQEERIQVSRISAYLKQLLILLEYFGGRR
jgi:origin recognition complex subunit 3